MTDPIRKNRTRKDRGAHVNGAHPASVTTRCRTIDGTVCEVGLAVLTELTMPGSQLATRVVSVDGGPPLLQKWVRRPAAGQPGPLAALDREIRALHRFALAFPADPYPRELPRLLYYDVDGAEPFVLLELYRGAPVAEVLQQLSAQDRYQLQVGLLRALHLAGTAGVTHGRGDLDTVRWDAATEAIQLVDFERAALVGEPDPGRADGGPADVRDDVWDAGLAIWRVSYPAHTGRGAPDLTEDGGALSALLDGVFADSLAARPDPEDLLARLEGPTAGPAIDLTAPLRDGQRAFDQAMQRKRARREAVVTPPPSWPSRIWAVLTTRRKRRRVPETPPRTLVRCPVCLDSYPLPGDDELWFYEKEEYQLDISGGGNSRKDGSRRIDGYRRCPNPSKDAAEHYLPATYHDHGVPLVVAMIGGPAAGKTHLLAAMIHQVVERGGLTPYGLTATLLDLHRHDAYRRKCLIPIQQGERLPSTPERVSDPAEVLLIHGPGGARPLVFFDVAGEDLRAVGDRELARFLAGITAAIFVHGLEPAPERGGNQAFEMSLARLRAVPDLEKLPAAIVATKSDRLRYLPPVDRWMRHERGPLAPVDAALLRAESRDVFAFLHHRQEQAALAPFSVFDRCTLHFVSASGGEAAPGEKVFPRGFAPSRVLEPLVAILAMAGMIEGAQAPLVGSGSSLINSSGPTTAGVSRRRRGSPPGLRRRRSRRRTVPA
jgi:hypothetical protein